MRFFEVFDSLKADKKLTGVYEDIEVTRITDSRSSDDIHIYLESNNYIRRSYIIQMQDLLFKQLFRYSGKNGIIHIFYPQTVGLASDSVWDKYHIYLEDLVFEKSTILGQIFRNSNMTFNEGVVTLDMIDSFLSRERFEEIRVLIEKSWEEQFGRKLSVVSAFHAPRERGDEEEFMPRPSAEEKAGTGRQDSDDPGNKEKGIENKNSGSEPRKPQQSAEKKSFDGAKRAPGSFTAERRPAHRVPSDDPDIFYGRAFDGDPIRIKDIQDGIGDVIVRGCIIKYEDRETRSGKIMVNFAITDYTDSIMVKLFLNPEDKDDVIPKLKKGTCLKLKGAAIYDTWSKDVVVQSIWGIKTIPDFRQKRRDDAPVKRIEFHAHTQMSDMDGVIPAGDLVKTAFKWGHKGIAITDHGVVQSFPIANHAIDWKSMPEETDEQKAEKERAKNFKIIYGCEGYLVDDEPDEVIDGKERHFKKGEDGNYSIEDLRKMPCYHIILLCKNDTGRVNLYKLVSEAHLTYFGRFPRIPKSVLAKNREGIIVGSACEAGELFRAVVHNKPEDEVKRIAAFYDYYEIQQIGNNAYMIDDPKFPEVESEDDLRLINRKIVNMADRDGKLCIATNDVHFLNPEDEIYRRIIMASKGFADADRQAPLYLHTTNEMLEECSYLGDEKAYEVVVENPNKLFDMIEKISPVRPDKCPPVIEDSDKTLREICENRAHAIYGPELPEPVSNRLEHELESIIKNGFAVMYIIAQKLVWKSNEDGYLVGSRGSVGSSFVATMSGITEINPLPPHYYCKECHYSEFDSETCKEYSAKSGCDMPDKVCPKCGAKLVKEGHNIPFETFLGFYGDKEPDIDLNFSGEYQSKAHDYTEVIFGAGQTFRAGTIGSLAEKTAFGLVSKYCEERNIEMRTVEKERIAEGCVGVRRTTGQHPGGIVVLPLGESIYSFTPIQHPANDMTVPTITTHFEYHSIDHNLLKLDILGHDDPTMIRMLEDLTGLDAKTIPMDDPGVISLFESTKALGITPEDIGGIELGSLGLPELGTNFVMQMLKDTKPQCFSDMVKIAGLSHGTDVWLNNAQEFIRRGDCTLSTAICTRDDIMIYLISKGLEPGLAFKTMESVRKGKGLKPEMEKAMVEHEVPEWYIESCKRIKYMFPKAHACAYIMMAFRIAYFKIYYPLAYYAAYFSIRASSFDYKKMCLGKKVLQENMKANMAKPERTAKDEDEYDDMKSVLEMYARGYEFEPIDIYKAKARHFQIVNGKLMPSLNSIGGLGDKAAEQIFDGASKNTFISKEDLKTKCHIGDSLVTLLSDLGILNGMPDSDQMSFADFFGSEM